MMLLNLVMAGVFLVAALGGLAPNELMVNVGYSTDGGAWLGEWHYFFGFVMLALILGVLHTGIAIQMYDEKGRAPVMIFLTGSILVSVIGTVVVGGLIGGVV